MKSVALTLLLSSVQSVKLGSKGVPVLMEPHNLRVNELAEADLHQRNYVIDGIDGYGFV